PRSFARLPRPGRARRPGRRYWKDRKKDPKEGPKETTVSGGPPAPPPPGPARGAFANVHPAARRRPPPLVRWPVRPRTSTNMSRTTTDDLEVQLERHRRELTAYAYRMLGSSFEAEDAVQEAFLRAWKNFDTFAERSSLRSWLYAITTNVCLDMLSGKERRARPMDLG